MNRKRFSAKNLIFVAIISLIVGIFITSRFDITTTTSAGEFWKDASNDATPMGPPSFAELAKKLMPPVVNISTTQVIKKRTLPLPEFKFPFDDFFGEEFFKKFYNGPPREFKRHSLGSGFIINKDGYILTNYHVIENATEIIVTLSEGKRQYTAEVVGKDKKLDLALIKIEAKEELPTTVLGDSDKLQIGEWVIAIGNPFGLGGTVTAGIVSQKGRVIGAGPYDNFIQTDASINPGNSGGPLFNTRGEVVGINTAIIAGGQGIGFAIPINMVKDVLVQLKERGKVIRGWIGVTIQQIDQDLAISMGLDEKDGVIVYNVTPDSPAHRAGIRRGDIIKEVDRKPIRNVEDLRKALKEANSKEVILVRIKRRDTFLYKAIRLKK